MKAIENLLPFLLTVAFTLLPANAHAKPAGCAGNIPKV